MKVTPETLRADKAVRDMLWPFDFAVVGSKAYGPVWFDTAPLEPFEIVAQRGSGCIYALTGPQRHVLLATNRGVSAAAARAAWTGRGRRPLEAASSRHHGAGRRCDRQGTRWLSIGAADRPFQMAVISVGNGSMK
jgi:hypothetical protein